jgi:GNAT superfamily N-acetyltransferase
MEIRTIPEEEKKKAFALAQSVILSETGKGWSEKGAEGILSFFEEKLAGFAMNGLYEKEDLKAVLAYDEERNHIVLLVVKKEEQHKGYGSALLKDFLAKEEAAGVSRISVNAAGNAVGFYANMGFEAVAPEDDSDGLRFAPMEYLAGKKLLGKTVTVTVDHPLGSLHGTIADQEYPVNAGYISNPISLDGELREAYVCGVEEPVDSFTGVVIAIVYRLENDAAQYVVSPPGQMIDHDRVINDIAFEEQYYETRIVWADGEDA